jgi:hypothetical protein
MAYFVETEEFDSETLNILGNALDEAWLRVKMAAPMAQRLGTPGKI